MKKLLSSLAVISTLALSSVTAHAESGFQFSFWAPDLQIVPANEDVNGLRIDLIYGENANVTGFDWGFLGVGVTTGNFKGFAWSWGGSTNGDASGVLWQGFYSNVDGKFAGWQSALIGRLNGESTGLQTSLVGLVDGSIHGVQFGFFNKAESVRGLQLGFVNWAENLEGLQIGLINYAKNSDLFPVFPFVNWQF
ncbi:LA_2272 family surface repeat-containing protein [Geminisphaera colitermitum]|uniref:LA_2272 family surface repeat-containing protein n=1 Tax=Geminisphaera colitermitum TaxID=1148786 RepID=UPI000158CF08|nr:hypothetical protein [Geminisphaera colitermitum]